LVPNVFYTELVNVRGIVLHAYFFTAFILNLQHNYRDIECNKIIFLFGLIAFFYNTYFVLCKAYSRRGDLETLGYNLLQWLCGHLPWEDTLSDGEAVHACKNNMMSNLALLMRQCFPDGTRYGKFVLTSSYN